jgi:hypothetical protein
MTLCYFQGELTTGTWEEKSVTLHYADFCFALTRHQLKQDGTLHRDTSLGDVTQASSSAGVSHSTAKASTINLDEETG